MNVGHPTTEPGELVVWDDIKGFGFVLVGTERLFVHISAFDRPDRRPVLGDELSIERGPGRNGQPTVVRALISRKSLRKVPGLSAQVAAAQLARAMRITGAAVLALLVTIAESLDRAPTWLLLLYFVVGAISALGYWLDKRAALAKGWRVSEATLLVIDLLFGIIGGLLAQAGLHHKTAKPGYAATTIVIALLHLLALTALATGLLRLPGL